MKVLHILQSSHFSGAENVVCQIITMMKDVPGFEAVYCSCDGTIRKALDERLIKFVPVNKLSVKEIRRVIREEKPDIIHAHDRTASLITSICCGKIPYISHIHYNAVNIGAGFLFQPMGHNYAQLFLSTLHLWSI